MSVTLTGIDGGTSAAATSGLRRAVRQLLHNKVAVAGLVIVTIFVISAVLSPLISPYSVTTKSCAVFAPPSATHWLGCDGNGIDVLSLVLHGGATSMIVGIFSTLIAMLIGGGIGIISGYFGRWADMVLMRITDYFLVVPQIVLMIVVATVWGPSLSHVIIVIGILMWTGTARVVRAQVMSLREQVFVRRIEALGASHSRIILRHVLPHVGPILVAEAIIAMTAAIFNETALAFLGLSDPNGVTWGTIMEQAFNLAAVSSGAWWAIAPAGIAVALFIVGCYFIGRSLEDSLNPRLKVSYLSAHSWKLRPLVGRGPEAI